MDSDITYFIKNKEKRMKKTEKSLRILWDNIKYTSIHIIRVPEGEEREKGPEKYFKIKRKCYRKLYASQFEKLRCNEKNKLPKLSKEGITYWIRT